MCQKIACWVEACLINYSLHCYSCHVSSLLSFSFPPCQALLLCTFPLWLASFWSALSVSTRLGVPAGGGQWNQAHTCSSKCGKWNPGTSAQRGARLKETWRLCTGQCWPASGRRGLGDRAQWSAASLTLQQAMGALPKDPVGVSQTSSTSQITCKSNGQPVIGEV